MHPYVRADKLELIDRAYEMGVESFADLGGSWGVEGYYSLHTLEKGVGQGYIVDLFYPDGVKQLERQYSNFRFVQGDFALMPEIVPRVNAIYLFDVLLHQYDWKEMLGKLSGRADMFLVHNPMWRGDESVRLTKLSEEEYYRVTPHYKGDPLCAPTFDDPGGLSSTGRLNRDSLAPFQWGITKDDLRMVMTGLGFDMAHYSSSGIWLNCENFEAEGFIFEKCR